MIMFLSECTTRPELRKCGACLYFDRRQDAKDQNGRKGHGAEIGLCRLAGSSGFPSRHAELDWCSAGVVETREERAQ